MKEDRLDDIDLLRQIAAGEKEAFTKLYLHYSPAIYNAIMVYIKNESEADDLLQNVFIRIWENRQELAGVENAENYLFIIARNMTINQIKRKVIEGKALKVFQSRVELPTDPIGNRLLEIEFKKLLHAAIDALPAQQKQVYKMATEDAATYEEIADRMSLSKLTVKKHLELARKSVRSYLNQRLHCVSAGTIFLISNYLFGR